MGKWGKSFFGGGVIGKFLLGGCSWHFRTPNPLYFTLWPIINPILVLNPYQNFLTHTILKMCDFIQVNLLGIQPRYNKSSRENATSSSSTFALAHRQEVPPRGKSPFFFDTV